jgi:hypothetical protein
LRQTTPVQYLFASLGDNQVVIFIQTKVVLTDYSRNQPMPKNPASSS